MRFSIALLALPALAAAQAQIPLMEQLQGLFEKAKSFLPASPVAAGAAKVAAKNVTPLTMSNYWSVLEPTPAGSKLHENWMVLITGGNKTCFGKCGPVDEAFNKTAAIFAADSKAPNLASIDCENEPTLCNKWAVGPPALYYIEAPTLVNPNGPATRPVRYFKLNATAVTTQDLVDIHRLENYKKQPVMQSVFHPFDGVMANTGLSLPLAYLMTVFSMVPSWVFMVAISFFSRSFMTKRVVNTVNKREELGKQATTAGRTAPVSAEKPKKK